jgi:hypothetical protein
MTLSWALIVCTVFVLLIATPQGNQIATLLILWTGMRLGF